MRRWLTRTTKTKTKPLLQAHEEFLRELLARAEAEKLRAAAAELQAAVVHGRAVIDQARELVRDVFKEMDAKRRTSE